MQEEGLTWDNKPTNEYWNELFRISKNQIVWGGNFFGLKGGVIAWNKNGTAFGEGEVAICTTHNSVRFFEYTWNGMLQGNMKNKEMQKYINSMELVKSMKLGGKISLVIAKNNKKLSEAKEVYEATRRTLAEQYCVKDEAGKPLLINNMSFQFDTENLQKIDAELAVVGDEDNGVELELIDIEPLIEQFSDITPEQVSALLLLQKPKEKEPINEPKENIGK